MKKSLAGLFRGDLENFVLAVSYSRLATTIASTGLNFRVRKENGCDPSDKPPEQNFEDQMKTSGPWATEERHESDLQENIELTRLPQFLASVDALRPTSQKFCRLISTPRLSALLHVHLVPINVVISHESQRFLILESASRLDAFSGYPIPT